MKDYLRFTIYFIFISFNSFAQTSWELLNPTPSFQTGLDIHFVSAEHGYIITGNQIIETTDSGNTWKIKQTVNNYNYNIISDFAFYDSLGFIIGKNGLVLKTVDNGSTWNKINIGINQNLNTINIINSDTIIISSSNKIIKSFDGGNAWEKIDVPNETINTTFFVSGKIGHAGCSNGKIIKTIDGGINWYATEEVSITPSEFIKIYFVDNNLGFASREHDKLFKTEDGGETWKEIPNISDKIYTINFINKKVGFVGGENGAILKTTDGGDNWKWVSFLNVRRDFSNVYGLYFFNKNTGYAVGNRGRIVKTIDGGKSWREYSPTYIDIDQIDFLTPKTGYALVRNNLFKTIDKGVTWKNLGYISDNTKTKKVEFVDKNLGYSITGGNIGSTGQSRYIYKSVNGGISWVSTNNGKYIEQYIDLNSINFINKNIGYISGKGYFKDGLFKTIDGGNSWSKIADLNFSKMKFFSETLGYAIKKRQKILYKTTDGGKNWEKSIEGNENIIDFDFIDSNNGYLVGEDALLFKTEDGGINWQKLEIPYADYKIVRFITKNTGYIVNNNGTIYKTENGGNSWDVSISIYSINDMCFSDKKVYVGGSYGKILSSDYNIVSVQNIFKNSDFNITLYPNPSKDYFYVKSDTKNVISSINVYDITGKRIQIEQLIKNANDIHVYIPNKLRGIYIVEVILDDKSIISKKLIVY